MTKEELMRKAIELSKENVENGGHNYFKLLTKNNHFSTKRETLFLFQNGKFRQALSVKNS